MQIPPLPTPPLTIFFDPFKSVINRNINCKLNICKQNCMLIFPKIHKLHQEIIYWVDACVQYFCLIHIKSSSCLVKSVFDTLLYEASDDLIDRKPCHMMNTESAYHCNVFSNASSNLQYYGNVFHKADM